MITTTPGAIVAVGITFASFRLSRPLLVLQTCTVFCHDLIPRDHDFSINESILPQWRQGVWDLQSVGRGSLHYGAEKNRFSSKRVDFPGAKELYQRVCGRLGGTEQNVARPEDCLLNNRDFRAWKMRFCK